LQKFLKDNPFIIKPNAGIVPKQKLGDDFVTDFVLWNVLDQGPTYTFVELEKASHHILNRDGTLTSAVQKAISQTVDWEVWLQDNQDYLKRKLPRLETPQNLIVIGRTKDMDEQQRAKLRGYNHLYRNTTIWSYDDLVAQGREFIESAKLMSPDGVRFDVCCDSD
jgi:hypothetical protein